MPCKYETPEVRIRRLTDAANAWGATVDEFGATLGRLNDILNGAIERSRNVR